MPPSPSPTPPGAASALPRDQQFVHLHLHTEYSLLDGGNRIDKLVARVAELGMTAVGVTDHGNIFGAIAFAQACKEKGLKPILGVEAYVAPGPRQDRTYTGSGDGGFHLVLLAQDNTGWQNLLYLCSEAYLTGFYYKPRIDRDLLAKHSEGLIAINGHLGSEIGDALLDYERTGDERHWQKAVESAEWHKRAFGGEAKQRDSETARQGKDTPSPASLSRSSLSRFYIELQHHIREQNSINPHLIRLARELDLPLVCDNDAHFLRAEDHDAHDTLVCISTTKNKNDPERMKYPPQLYVKSPAEMRALAKDMAPELAAVWAQACDNTVAIAERCDVKLPLGANNAPMVRIDVPKPKDLPKHDDPRFNSDLTAWYKAFSAKFELKPFTSQPTKEQLAEAKEECDAALKLLAEAGFVWRYGPDQASSHQGTKASSGPDSMPGCLDASVPSSSERRSRLDRELKILCDKNIAAYFLIVWDFVNWGRQRGIPALARGSGVGTMVGYVMGLSNACPVQYGLLFERFTDPDRSEYPDIDIDLCQDGRADVINYVRNKYGHVAQIITFGTMKARAAIRDVARVLGVSLPVADRVAKLIPEQLNITLDEAIAAEPDLRSLYDGHAKALDKVNDKLPPEQHTDADTLRRLIDNARTLEGQARHASVHAAGVIVATRPLHEIVPLYKQTGAAENEIVTQWDGPTCEKMGLLKMDFLGLRTLTVVERAKKLIREGLAEEEIWKAVGRAADYEAKQRDSEAAKQGKKNPVSRSRSFADPLDLDRLSYTDQRVFEMFRRGDTTGVFQFESGGMRRLLVEMKPDRLEDLIAANALFRPGPMDLIPDYNRRKHGTEDVPKVHEIVDRYTAETYGVMVYQEQVMQIVHGLGGISLRNAYSLIKAISKKKQKQIDAERPNFIAGAVQQGLTKPKAEELFELILKFAGYGFNKSHSTGYAIVAYQTAYLKTYFPNQYMAAFLTYESQANKVSEWMAYLEDARRCKFIEPTTGKVVKVGVEVRPPDINFSDADFAVVFEDAAAGSPGSPSPGYPIRAHAGHVRFGLKAIKGSGDKAINAIISERAKGPFTSLFDFCERVLAKGQGVLNKATLEALIKSGTFDRVHGRPNRAAMTATIEQAMSAGQKAAADRASGQGALFGFSSEPRAQARGGSSSPDPTTALAKAQPWTEAESLAHEKATLGFYVSSHPLDTWRAWYSVFATADTTSIKGLPQDARVILPGLVQSVRTIVAKTGRSAGQKMAIVTFEDTLGAVECVLFTDAYAKFGHMLDASSAAVLYMMGRVDRSRGDAQIIVERVVPIDGTPVLPGRLQLVLDDTRLNGSGPATLAALADLIKPKASAGPAGFPLELVVLTNGTMATLQTDPRLRVGLDAPLVNTLAAHLGPNAVRVVGGVTADAEKGNGRPWEQKKRGSPQE